MSKQKIEIEVDVPDGMEIDGKPVTLGGERTQGFCFSFKAVEPKKESQFINLYPQAHPAYGTPRSTRESADKDEVGGRVGVVRIDFENDIPVHVTLEPTP